MLNLAEFEVLSRTPYAWVNEKRELISSTFVVYRDAEGRVGTIVVPKAKPSDAEVLAAVKKRRGA